MEMLRWEEQVAQTRRQHADNEDAPAVHEDQTDLPHLQREEQNLEPLSPAL